MSTWIPTGGSDNESPLLNGALLHYIQDEVISDVVSVSPGHQESITELSDYITEAIQRGEELNFTVICTHNSRRSHMGQLWLAVAATYYGLNNIRTYSGGTEQTAFNPRAVASLQRAGFRITTKNPEMKNPVYEARWLEDEAAEPLVMFSKKYDDVFNPKSGFVAIMVCGEADAACPVVLGAAFRCSLPFDDPKHFDGTEEEAAQYDHTCRLIAREMFYLLRQVKSRIKAVSGTK